MPEQMSDVKTSPNVDVTRNVIARIKYVVKGVLEEKAILISEIFPNGAKMITSFSLEGKQRIQFCFQDVDPGMFQAVSSVLMHKKERISFEVNAQVESIALSTEQNNRWEVTVRFEDNYRLIKRNPR